MRTASLSLVFLLLSSLYLQAQTLSLRSKQVSLALETNTFNILSAFGFPLGLIQKSPNSQAQTQKIADLFIYYIDGKIFSNTVSSLFDKNQQNNLLTYDQLKNALSSEGVQDTEIQHVFNLVSLDQDDLVNYAEFTQMANVIFNEALTVVTWVYMTKNPVISPSDRVDLDTVEDAILTLFKKFEGTYPPPRCEEIEYLFRQADKDDDGKIDIQGFHYVLSIFLKYYQAGISSNQYAGLIFDDDFFDEAFGTDSSNVSESDYPGHTETSSFWTESDGTETDSSSDSEETEGDSGSFPTAVDELAETETGSEPSDWSESDDEDTQETETVSDSGLFPPAADEQTEATETGSEDSDASESDDQDPETVGDSGSFPPVVDDLDEETETEDESGTQSEPSSVSQQSDNEKTEKTKKSQSEEETESDESDEDYSSSYSSTSKGNSENTKKWNFSSSSSTSSHFSFGNKNK